MAKEKKPDSGVNEPGGGGGLNLPPLKPKSSRGLSLSAGLIVLAVVAMLIFAAIAFSI